MNVEKLLHRSVPLWFLLFLILSGLLVLMAFGALVGYASSGGRRFQALTSPALAIANIPLNAARAVTAPTEPITHENREDLPAGFWRNPQSTLVDDGYALISGYDAKRKRYLVDLTRLSDGKVIHEYAPDIAAITSRSKIGVSTNLSVNHPPGRYRMTHPLLMPDGGIIFHDGSPEVRIDACSRILWTLDGIFDHSNEVDADGNIWVPDQLLTSKLPHVGPAFREDLITKISPGGRLLRAESIAAILERNDLAHLWRSFPYANDPTHLNDIQPVLQSGPYWQKGDLFISLRHLSLLMLYRPSTGRILWWRQGPWSMQHDVDILDDHRISVFDNGVQSGPDGPNPRTALGDYVVNHNRLYVYDFATGKAESPYEAAFAAQDIRTVTQGLATTMGNGDLFVEETNYGRLLRMAPDGTVRWRYVTGGAGGKRYELGWSRYLDPKADAAGIAAAANARCG